MIQQILDYLLFGCWHDFGIPYTVPRFKNSLAKKTYRVCIKCGKTRPYDLKKMQFISEEEDAGNTKLEEHIAES